MAELKKIICESCGRNLTGIEPYEVDGVKYLKCPACGNIYRLSDYNEPEFSPVVEGMLGSALLKYKAQDYDAAIDDFERIIEENRECYKAYWFRLLSKYGISFVEDNGKVSPTIARCSISSFQTNPDFKDACNYSTKTIRESYENMGSRIDKLRQEILDKSSTIPDFDVFISYAKNDVDDNGNYISETKSGDYELAHSIFNHFDKKGRTAFLSDISVPKYANDGSAEPVVFKAINTAKVFILVASEEKYATSKWVKNEWERYLSLIKQGKKSGKSMLVVLKTNVPDRYPNKLTKLQTLLFSDDSFYSKIDANFDSMMVESALNKFERKEIALSATAQKKKNIPVVSFAEREIQVFNDNKGIDIDEYIQNAKEIVEQSGSGSFKMAIQNCDEALSLNPHSYDALILKTLAQNACRSEKDFCINYQKYDTINKLDAILQTGVNSKGIDKIKTLAYNTLTAVLKDKNWECLNPVFKFAVELAKPGERHNIANKTTKLIIDSFNPEDETETRNIFNNVKDTIDLIFKVVSDDSDVYIKRIFDFARAIHNCGLYQEAIVYYDIVLSCIYDSRTYLNKFLARLKMKKVTDDKIIPSVSEDGLKLFVNYVTTDYKWEHITDLFNLAISQLVKNNGINANRFFNAALQFVSEKDVKTNKHFILPYAEQLLVRGDFNSAKMYYDMLLGIDDSCSEAYWGLLKCKVLCLTDRDLVYYTKDFSMDTLYMKALGSARKNKNESLRAYYGAIVQLNQFIKEVQLERNAYTYLADGQFTDAEAAFQALIGLATDARGEDPKSFSHPNAYWGLVLARLKCENDYAFAEKYKIESDIELSTDKGEMDFVFVEQKDRFIEEIINKLENSEIVGDAMKNYEASMNNQMAILKLCETNKKKFKDDGNKATKLPVSLQEISNRLVVFDNNHLEIIACLMVQNTAKEKLIKQQNELQKKADDAANENNRVQDTINLKIKNNKKAKTIIFVVSALLAIGALVGGIIGSKVFYTSGVARSWFNAYIGDGTPIGISAAVGAGIGLIGGLIAGLGPIAAATAIGGAIVVIILCLIGCWAVAPLAAVIVISAIIALLWWLNSEVKDKVKDKLQEMNAISSSVYAETEATIANLNRDAMTIMGIIDEIIENNTVDFEVNNDSFEYQESNSFELYDVPSGCVDIMPSNVAKDDKGNEQNDDINEDNQTGIEMVKKQVKCPSCGSIVVFEVPKDLSNTEPGTKIKIQCENCKKAYMIKIK